MDFVAYDLETTGIDPEKDAIVEIGAVRFIGGLPREGFSALVDPGRPIPPDATRVNGITDDQVAGQPAVEAVLAPFADYCGDLTLVAHNARFDYRFLVQAIKTHRAKAPTGVTIDTFTLAKTVVPGLPNYRLDTLVRHFRFEGGGYHRAEQDAALCGQVFQRMVSGLKDAGHRVDIPALLELTGKKELRFPQVAADSEQLGLF